MRASASSFLATGAPVAYCGQIPDPERWWAAWTWDPVVAIMLLVVASALWRVMRGATPAQARAATAAWWGLFVLFVSPLCALSAAMFSVRTLHHLALVLLVAPLLARALPEAENAPPRAPWQAPAAFVAFGLALWTWHAPQAYERGLVGPVLFWIMQATLLGAATLFWRVALSRRTSTFAAVLMLLGSTAHMGLLGALIAFSTQSLYPLHAAGAMAFGLLPRQDQQLGGLLMWVPAAVPMLAAGLWRGRRLAMADPAATVTLKTGPA